MVLLTLRLLWVSDADRNTAISRMPPSSADSSPRRLGTRAEKRTSGRRATWRATDTASASCGIHLGLTKLVISMAGRPVKDSESMSATLSAVASWRDSFCSPSRGPTSKIVTCLGSFSKFTGTTSLRP